jgi:hypothetical protein
MFFSVQIVVNCLIGQSGVQHRGGKWRFFNSTLLFCLLSAIIFARGLPYGITPTLLDIRMLIM